MSFLLDTDHLSAHLRRPSGLAHRFMQHSGRLYTPSVALARRYDQEICEQRDCDLSSSIGDARNG
jgi:hypothetical protein